MSRRRMGPERPFAVIMAIAALMLGGIRWTLPGPVDGWEYAYRAGCAVFALLCLWGAWQLWQMGRER